MLKYIDDIKQVLEKEIDKISKTGDISVNTLEKLHKLTDTYKNFCKIEMLSDDEEMDGGSSYRRGRGKYANRDSMGRYSSEDGYSERGMSYDDDMSYARHDMGRGGNMTTRGGYSRDDAKDHMMHKLGAMMEDADPKEREALKECMRAIERA